MAPLFVLATVRATNAQAADEIEKCASDNEFRLTTVFAAVREHAAKNEPGTLLFEPVRNMEDPLEFSVFEQYAGMEAVGEHTKSAPFRALGQAGKKLFEGGSKGLTIKRFTPVSDKAKL